MSSITVALPEEDLVFLQEYSAAHGTSAEAILARHARSLRERLQTPLPSVVEAATGIIDPEIDAETVYRAYLEAKYK